MKFRLLSYAVITANFVMASAWAHHSHGNYKMTEYSNLTGTVKEVHFVNPHSWIYLEVMDETSQPVIWALESAGAGGLARIGITDEIISEGDVVSVRCHQLRDGANGCLLGWLTTVDGVEREWD
mgnify:FL=1|jgi:hypothetical protein